VSKNKRHAITNNNHAHSLSSRLSLSPSLSFASSMSSHTPQPCRKRETTDRRLPTEMFKALRLLWFLAALRLSSSLISVTVDSTGGNDTACQSILELIAANLTSSSVSCKSINRALGSSGGASSCEKLRLNSSGILDGVDEEVTVVLADGEHLLEGKPRSGNIEGGGTGTTGMFISS